MDRAVSIVLDDGRAVQIESDGHITVFDSEGNVEMEMNVLCQGITIVSIPAGTRAVTRSGSASAGSAKRQRWKT